MSEEKKVEEQAEEQSKIALKLLSPVLEDGKPSVGRIMLISTFGLAISMWAVGKEIPQTMLTILITLIGYVISSKAVGTIKDVANKVKDTKEIVAKIKRKE